MSATPMWTSKLGNKYPMAWMQQNDQTAQKELKRLRGLRGNCTCADCGRQDNSWASVSHGVFICVTCSDVHRSVGTHVTKVKGCTGTYLWGPDELEKMTSVGNQGGNKIYGAEKIDPGASKEKKQRYVVEKYEKLSFAGRSVPARLETHSPSATAKQPKSLAPRVEVARSPPSDAMPQTSQQHADMKVGMVSTACEVTDSLFDELFNEAEDSYFGNSSVVLKSQSTNILTPISPPCSGGDNGLDSFLNSTLSVHSQSACPATQGYPAGLDPFANSQTARAEDPFANWPEF